METVELRFRQPSLAVAKGRIICLKMIYAGSAEKFYSDRDRDLWIVSGEPSLLSSARQLFFYFVSSSPRLAKLPDLYAFDFRILQSIIVLTSKFSFFENFLTHDPRLRKPKRLEVTNRNEAVSVRPTS